MNNNFFDSKTMQLMCVCIGVVILLIAIGVAVKVLFGEDVFTMVAAGIGSITGQGAMGTYRNVQTDAPIRQQYAGRLSDPPV